MRISRFYHSHGRHSRTKKDFRLFELAIMLHMVAESLVWVFVPILMLQSGYSVTDILVYLLAFNAIDVPLNFGVDRLMRRFGARKVMIAGTFAIIAFFLLIGVLPTGNILFLLLLACLGAIYDTFFWVSHMYLFIEINKEEKDSGASVGALGAVHRFGGIVGPIVGACILVVWGKETVALVAALLFAASMIPLFRMKHTNDIPQGRQPTMKEFLSSARERKNYLSTALIGVHYEVDGNLWPLFIFMTLGSIESVALIPTLVALSTASFSFVAGKMTKRHALPMMICGSLFAAALWTSRIIFQNEMIYYLTVLLIGFSVLLVETPIDADIARRGAEKSTLSAATYRNASSMLLRIPLYLVLLLLVHVFKTGFAIAAISILLVCLVIFFYFEKNE